MLERNLTSNWYYQDSPTLDREFEQELDHVYSQSSTANQVFWREAQTDMRFSAGDQSVFADVYGSRVFHKKQFFFNRIMRVKNMLTGYQRQHRKSTVVTGLEEADDATASQRSKVLFWAQKQAGVDEALSQAFEYGAVETGRNFISVSMRFNNDPISGDIFVENVGALSVLIDPFYRKQDLSDCNFIWRRQWLSRDQLKRYLPGRESEFDHLKSVGNNDGKFELQAQNYNFAMSNLFPVDEYCYLTMRDQSLLIDVETKEAIEWNGEDDDPQVTQFMQQNPSVEIHHTKVPTVKMKIRVNGKCMYSGPTSLDIDRYPFVPIIGYYNPDLPYSSYRCQGVVRGLRDAQFIYNRRRVVELDILESQITSGFKYKPGSLVNPDDIYLQGQGKGIALQDDALMTDVEQIIAPQIPPSMLQLSEIIGNEITQISGVNEELLGAADDDKAGVLAMLRQSAGLTTLQKLFDQLDFSQQILGQVFIDAISKNFKPSKVKRIIGEEPTDQFFNYSFSKYDAVIEEGVNTSVQRQAAFQQALHLREIGIPVPSEYLLGLLATQDADKLRKAVMQAEQQQAQQQQQQQQVEMGLMASQKEKTEAEALAMSGYGLKHLADIRKVESEIVENRSQAIERVEQAKLDKVKAIKEISDMELNQIQRMVEIYNAIKVGQDADAASEAAPQPNSVL